MVFCRHLMDLSPVGSRFNTMVVSGELRNYFTQEEIKEMNQYIKESSSLSYSDIYDDATTMCSSYPNSRGQETGMFSYFDFLKNFSYILSFGVANYQLQFLLLHALNSYYHKYMYLQSLLNYDICYDRSGVMWYWMYIC